jgi:DNA-binding transcriptional MocR family regulator
MYDTVQYAIQYGVGGGNLPWSKQGKIKFICPSPGYDRHFGICSALGIEMITVPMTITGPDMDMVEMLCESDKSIKGIWCVPKYTNPLGITFSDEVVERLVRMKTAAPDFRIFWDNAYFTHFIYEKDDKLKNIMSEAEKAGNPDRVYMFASTSKITFAGSGIAAFMASESNIAEALSHLKYQTISANKINQLMHVEFLKNKDTITKIMRAHADIMRPKFEVVINTLESEFGASSDIVNWVKPNGGYFVSVNVLSGCAKRVVALAKEIGVVFTNAGATFPNGVDDFDSNIRIAPSFPTMDEMTVAMKVFVCVAKIAAFEKLMKN